MNMPTTTDTASEETRIVRAARWALRWSPSLVNTDIHTFVRDGCVTLKGLVDFDHQIAAADAAVRHIPGVTNVVNKVRVRNANVADRLAEKPSGRQGAFLPDIRG